MTKIAHLPDRHPAAASPGAWYEAVVGANAAWLSVWAGVASAMASAAETQAQFAGEMTRLWLDGKAPAGLDMGGALAEQGLLLAQAEGERLAEAARRSLFGLCGHAIVAPLPE